MIKHLKGSKPQLLDSCQSHDSLLKVAAYEECPSKGHSVHFKIKVAWNQPGNIQQLIGVTLPLPGHVVCQHLENEQVGKAMAMTMTQSPSANGVLVLY